MCVAAAIDQRNPNGGSSFSFMSFIEVQGHSSYSSPTQYPELKKVKNSKTVTKFPSIANKKI